MWSIAVMIAYTAAGTQFIKLALAKRPLCINIEKVAAVVLSCIVAAVVVVFAYLNFDKALNLHVFLDFVQVAIGANMGYSLLKVARPQQDDSIVTSRGL